MDTVEKKVNGLSKKSQHVLGYQPLCYSPVKFYGHRYKISRVGTFYTCMETVQSEIQLLYSFMKYDYEKLISPSFREFYKLSIDI